MRPLRRFCRARDDVTLCRGLITLREARTVRACDFAAGDFRDLVFFAPLARNRRPLPFRDLGRNFLPGVVWVRLSRLPWRGQQTLSLAMRISHDDPWFAPATCQVSVLKQAQQF